VRRLLIAVIKFHINPLKLKVLNDIFYTNAVPTSKHDASLVQRSVG
jgi:hypothetical protein